MPEEIQTPVEGTTPEVPAEVQVGEQPVTPEVQPEVAAPEVAPEAAPEVAPEAPVEEVAPEAPAEEVGADEQRDPSTPVSSEEELVPEEVQERENYLVQHPEERTAHDPFPADGNAVGAKDGSVA